MSRPIAGRDRAAAATGALLLQIAFIAAFLHAFSTQAPPRQLERELTFFLPRLLSKPAPVAPAPHAPSAPVSLPLFAPPLLYVRPAPPITNAPPAGLENFGRTLFGCAPENYTDLTSQQRALCPPLGQGTAAQDTPNPPSHVKDEAYWKEELRQKQAPKLLFGLGGAYPVGKPMSLDQVQVEEMTTWDPCPPVANAPCLHNIAQGLPQPGTAGVPPSVKGVRLHPQ